MSVMHIKDESGDKKFFTIIPNFILNHSTANDQALYLQMKRIAGEGGGVCEAGYRYFTKQLGIGKVAYWKSLEYLLYHKWISFVGTKKIMTKGGVQSVNVYKVNDLWNMNNSFFEKRRKDKGGSERDHLPSKVGLETLKGGSETEQKKNPKEDKDASSLGARERTPEEIQKYEELNKKMRNNLKKL